MKWEHKIGIAITCTFLCLIGAVIGLKMQEQTHSESSKVAAADLEEPTPIPTPPPSIQLANSEVPPPDPGSFTLPGNSNSDTPPPSPLSNNSPTPKTRGGVSTQSEDKKYPANVSIAPPAPVEPHPTARPVNGADQWDRFSTGSKKKDQSALPAAPKGDKKTEALSLTSAPDTKIKKSPKSTAPPEIVPVAGMAAPTALPDSKLKPTPASPSPTTPSSPPLGTASSSPPPPTAVNATNNAAQPALAFPSFLSSQATNATKTPDAKGKENISPTPIQPPGRGPEMLPSVAPLAQPPLAPPAQPPLPSAPPTVGAPIPAPMTPMPTSTSPPPLAPQNPVIIPGPTSTTPPAPPAAPVAPVTPPSSPKPPADGSSFVPDRSTSASGTTGVMPAPLPFPVPPPSSPLTAVPQKSAPARPASNGPSVTVYDEQDYSSRAGETWEEISKHFYMTDRYAKALQRHNQGHARASDRMKDNGQLAPGERIFVPQAYVLEQRYADAITKPAAAPAPTTMPVVYPNSPPPPPAPPVGK